MEQEKGAVYCRLSQDDGSAGESGSIQTQRTLLTQYCKEHSIQIVDYYCEKSVIVGIKSRRLLRHKALLV